MIPVQLPPNEEERLRALESYATLDSSPEASFDDLARLAALTCGTPYAFISLVTQERHWLKAAIGLELNEFPREMAFCAHTILGDELLIIPDARDDARFRDNPLVTSGPRIRFYAGIPLLTPDRVALGTLAVMDTVPRELNPGQIGALGILGRQVMAQLDLRRLHHAYESAEERIQRRTEELAAVAESLRKEVLERTRAQEGLREISDRLLLATQSGRIGIWDWNLPDETLLWDDGMHRLHGTVPGDFSPTIAAWEARIHPEDQAVHREGFAKALRGGPNFDGKFRVIWPDQSVHHVQTQALVQRDEAGRPFRVRGTSRDITELRSFEKELQRSQANLAVANRELVDFSYSISHDLRAPLRGIDGWSMALLEDFADRLDEKGRGYLDRVRSETQRLGHLIDDLLELSRVTQMEMRPTPVDLSVLAGQIGARLKEQDPGRAVDFVIQAGLSAWGDEGLLHSVLGHLIENAWKFSSKRSAALIEFGRMEKAGEVCFFVRDNGAGFDMEFATKLFAPFQRFHRATEYPGNGIGLATVQRVVQRHGGRIWAEATVNRGAVFYFNLG